MKQLRRRRFLLARCGTTLWVALAVLGGLLLAACSTHRLPVPVRLPTPTPFLQVAATATPAPAPDASPVSLRYALWDPAQVPAYAACARQFMDEHPNISIAVEQTDWPLYWDKLADDMAGGNGPDVFVNHVTRLPDLILAGHMIDLEPLVQRDGIDDSIYLSHLPRLWIRAGKRYGLPKDWETVALVYNKALLVAANVTAAELDQLTWNPRDGGTLERLLARLSTDKAGNNGLSPAFDPRSVAVYGLTMADRDGGGAYGQQQWSYLAASNGFHFIDYLYGDRYYYDDPALVETMAWYQRLINQRGYHTPFEQIAEQDGRRLFLDGKAAMIADASSAIARYVDEAPFDVGFARPPSGPQGRKSMVNGTADSIWSGTKHPEAAWEWVKYLGSVDCQVTVGEHAVTFPALSSGVFRMLDKYRERNVDVSAYVRQAAETDDLFLFPVTEHASQVIAIMQPVMEAIFKSEADPAVVLPAANDRVNALFEP